jgi:hypothetical protein
MWSWGSGARQNWQVEQMELLLNTIEWEGGKEIVYGWSRNDWLVIGTTIGASTVLHMKVWPWHVRSSTWADAVGQGEIEGDWY